MLQASPFADALPRDRSCRPFGLLGALLKIPVAGSDLCGFRDRCYRTVFIPV